MKMDDIPKLCRVGEYAKVFRKGEDMKIYVKRKMIKKAIVLAIILTMLAPIMPKKDVIAIWYGEESNSISEENSYVENYDDQEEICEEVFLGIDEKHDEDYTEECTLEQGVVNCVVEKSYEEAIGARGIYTNHAI